VLTSSFTFVSFSFFAAATLPLQADVYSFGVILWELATREGYFSEINLMGVRFRYRHTCPSISGGCCIVFAERVSSNDLHIGPRHSSRERHTSAGATLLPARILFASSRLLAA
jgi:hypothetical protein